MEKAYIAICIPASWATIPTTASLGYTEFIALLKSTNDLVADFTQLCPDRSNPVDRARSRLVKEALAYRFPQGQKATHLLLIDLDQLYPHGMLDQLLKWDKDIIGPVGFFKSRNPGHHKPFAQLTNAKGGADPVEIFDKHMQLIDEPVPCDVLGLGGLLVKREVFETLDGPWFRYDTSRRGVQEGISHDIHFCDDAKAHGFQPHVLPSCVSPHVAEVVIDEKYHRSHKMAQTRGEVPVAEPKEVSLDYMGYGEAFFKEQQGHFENDELFQDCWNITKDICKKAGIDNGRIIDYGSGNGKYAEMADWEVTSFDPEPYPQEKYGALGKEALKNQYDVIWCSEVMEHMESEDDAANVIDGWHDLGAQLAVCTINLRSGRDVCPTHFLMRTRGWWIDFFKEHGWDYQVELSETANWNEHWQLEYFVFKPETTLTSIPVTYQEASYTTRTDYDIYEQFSADSND